VVSTTIPIAVRQKPATRLGHGFRVGWSAAMTNAAIAKRIPATTDDHAKALTEIPVID